MKRRGFLGALFGAPVAVVAGKSIAEVPEVKTPPVSETPTLWVVSGDTLDCATYLPATYRHLGSGDELPIYRQRPATIRKK